MKKRYQDEAIQQLIRELEMEHVDVLYGVTMEQSGVSKLASVRLNEAEYDLPV